jgi:hypothetical protein
MAHVQVLGTPLPQELGAAPCEDGIVLKYFPEHEPSRDSGCSRPKWHDIETRIWRALKATGQGIGFNQELLSRLLGPSLSFAVDDLSMVKTGGGRSPLASSGLSGIVGD